MSLLAVLTVKVSAILLLALAGALCLRGSSASAKHWVLAVGVVAAVAAPALDVLPIPPVVPMVPVGPLVFDALRLGSYVLLTEPAAGVGVAELAAASQPPAAAVVAGGAVVGRMAVTIWLLGAVTSVGVLLVGLARLRWLRASSSRVTDGRWPAVRRSRAVVRPETRRRPGVRAASRLDGDVGLAAASRHAAGVGGRVVGGADAHRAAARACARAPRRLDAADGGRSVALCLVVQPVRLDGPRPAPSRERARGR